MRLVPKTTNEIVGPWKCEKCGQFSQFAEKRRTINFIFCRNEACRFNRIVDRRLMHIVEDDGSTWQYDGAGRKYRIRSQA